MHRRDLLKAIPALSLAKAITGAPAFQGRLRPGLVAYTYRNELKSGKLSYEDVIRMAADFGAEGVDTTVYYFPPDFGNEYLARLRRTAYRNGITLYSAAVRVKLAQPTPELQAAEVATGKKWIDAAERLGATHVRVFGGDIPKGASEEQAIGFAVEVMKRLAEYSATKGIVVGVEDDGGLTTNAGPAIEIVKRTDSPWAGMNLDTGNFPKDGYAQVEAAVPYAVSTHIKATVHSPEGKEEKADFERLFGLFAKGGYRGFVSLEYEKNDAVTAVPGLIAEMLRALRKYAV